MQHHLNKAVILLSVGLLLLYNSCHDQNPDLAKTALVNACDYLWSVQSVDGGWHSETHTIMRDGESLTPFILDALLAVPEEIYPQNPSDVENAIDFIRNTVEVHINSDSLPPILDYPNYTAAYALKVLVQNNIAEPRDSILIQYLTDYLIAQQFAEHSGFDTLHPAYGGWGFGEHGLPDGMTGHVDISHTRRVLEALALVLPVGHPVFLRSESYMARVQNDRRPGDSLSPAYLDGGFFSSIVTPETNKSLPVSENTWRSYATATCDGLLALLAAGVSSTDSRFTQAVEWLEEHGEMYFVEGIPHDDPMQWNLVMKYYHLAVRAETCAIKRCDQESITQMHTILINDQRKDGSFMNPIGGPNKEDDPLLATALAVIALAMRK